MICEHCGCVLEDDNIYIVSFTGTLLEFQSSHFACKKCSEEIYQDCLQIFNRELVERCINIKKVEVLSDDLQ